jgi:hypothetical protein
MNARKACCGFVLVIVFASAGPAWADDLTTPPWRGQPGSTFQEWTFATNANPATATIDQNGYGDPVATIDGQPAGETGWRNTLPGVYGSKQGWWDIGTGSIVLDIPNSGLTGPGTYKEIWVQLTYWRDISQAPVVGMNLPGVVKTYDNDPDQLVLAGPVGGGWYYDLTKWRVEPNPLEERIVITGAELWGSQIDQIVVDTICVPEPASLAGLACLVAVLLRRRGRA